MHAIQRIVLGLAAVLLCEGFVQAADSLDMLTLTENDRSIVVRTPLYQAELDKNRGYTLKEMSVQGSGESARVSSDGIVLMEEGEREKYNGQWFGSPMAYSQADAKVDCKILSNGPAHASIRLTWAYPVGTVEDTITFSANDRLIRHHVKFNYIKNMLQASFGLKSAGLSGPESESVFYPDAKRVGGVGNTGVCVQTPGYRFAYNPVRKAGFGLAVFPGDDSLYFHYFMRGAKEGWGGDLTRIDLFSKSMRWSKLPGNLKLDFAIVAGGGPDDVAASAGTVAISKLVTLDRVWPKKVIYRLGEAASAEVIISSHSDKEEKITLASTVTGGIDETREVDRRNIILHPKETVRLVIPWNSGSREWGFTFKTEVIAGGKVIDSGEEYTSATNFAPKVGQLSILGPAACQEGSEAAYIRNLRDNYYGIFEYYCWAPDQVLNLAPQTETWHAHTESQVAYEATLSKLFLTALSKEGNDNGVLPYVMDTGMISLDGGLDQPELFKYASNGQPQLFNGNIYDGKRRYAVGPANVYDPDVVKQWAERMSDSIDMFGWKGCRWDWGFAPDVPADPLGSDPNRKAQYNPEGAKNLWYDYKGRGCAELFADPDETGAALLHLWRETVSKKHPDFVYGVNFIADEIRQKDSPKYFKEATTNSMLLFEYLLECHAERYNTWQKYAEALTGACQRVRVNGGQPYVGYMRGLNPGGTSLRMAQYLIFASGVHWAGGGTGLRNSLDDTWKRFRFALRFSEYYYDPNFFLLPTERRGEVDVAADPRVLWKPFVYERKTGNSRDVTAHLLNLPVSDYIVEHHEAPSIKKDITVKVALKPGEKVKSVAIMLPDPAPHAVKPVWEVKGRIVNIKVPELETAAIVLVKIGG